MTPDLLCPGVAMKLDQRPTETAKVLSDKSTLLKLYREMLLIRRFEEKTAEMYQMSKIGGFCHLNIGEEATIVGTISALRKEDYVYSNYLEHGHAIVGEALPLACGAGYAIRYQDKDEVVMSIFGDGATNIGAFHESLNVAKLWKLPVVFVIINNQYGMGTAVSRASAVTELWKKALAYDMTGERVDGMDVLAVHQVTDRLVAQARDQHEPSLLECVTYRYRGHSMSDPDTYRGKQEVTEWRERDSILKFGEYLKRERLASDKDLEAIDVEVMAEVEAAVTFADESPDPDPKDLFRDVYADEAAS